MFKDTQKHTSSENVVCNCDSHESDKDPVVQEEKSVDGGKVFSKKRLLA